MPCLRAVTLAPASGGGRRPYTGRTGPDGRVTFRVAAGPQRGQVRYQVSSAGAPLGGESEVTLTIRAASPTTAGPIEDEPFQVGLDDVPVSLRMLVTDRFGNPTTGAETSLKTDRTAAGSAVSKWTSSSLE